MDSGEGRLLYMLPLNRLCFVASECYVTGNGCCGGAPTVEVVAVPPMLRSIGMLRYGISS